MNIHFQKLALVLTFTLILLPAPTFAIDWGEGIPNFQPSRPLLNGQGQHAAWEAVGRLTVEGGMDCTGALLDTRQTGAPSDAPAYVLTAGHCTHALNDPLSIIHDVDAEGSITFNYFEDTQAQPKVFKVKRITWSTLRGLDISIIELVPGLDTVIKSGIPPPQAQNRAFAGSTSHAGCRRAAGTPRRRRLPAHVRLHRAAQCSGGRAHMGMGQRTEQWVP